MHGILGINARNQKYLHTSRKVKRILDSKLLTKKLLQKVDLPVLETLAIIKTRSELFNFNWDSLPNAFALKPNRGLGGEGIVVAYGKKKNTGISASTSSASRPVWIKADGSLISCDDFELHILDILEGNFSLFSIPDVAFFEERAKVIKELKPYCAKGIPDIRVIVFENVPVMAMLRLPTQESKGRANLHQGAIGVGIDLETGLTTNATWHQKFIDYYPGTRYLLRGIKIPYFKRILELAVLAQNAVGINFLGVDIAIDRDKGPIIFELNARPGLDIQLANLAGLEERLQRVKGLKIKSKDKGVRIAQDLFGVSKEDFPQQNLQRNENEIEGLSYRKILGPIEEVEILTGPGEKTYKTLAKIDTGAWRSAISFDVAQKLNIQDKETSNFKMVKSALGEEIRTIIPLSFVLKGEKIDTEVFLADRSSMKYEMLIGRRDLKNFIIDPGKKVTIKK